MPDLRDAESMPDIGPGWEWHRERYGDAHGPRSRRLAWLPSVSLPRNGLPELPKPYVYRGTGVDVMAGSYGDERLDAPYDFLRREDARLPRGESGILRAEQAPYAGEGHRIGTPGPHVSG